MKPAKIVIRFADGKMLKGYTNDFFPKKPSFHVGKSPSEKGSRVSVNDLKAVFFVKDFDGNPYYDDSKEFSEDETYLGRRVEVTYRDGEVMVGTVLGYNPERPGFFMEPSDEQSNNAKVFVVSAAVKDLRFL